MFLALICSAMSHLHSSRSARVLVRKATGRLVLSLVMAYSCIPNSSATFAWVRLFTKELRRSYKITHKHTLYFWALYRLTNQKRGGTGTERAGFLYYRVGLTREFAGTGNQIKNWRCIYAQMDWAEQSRQFQLILIVRLKQTQEKQ